VIKLLTALERLVKANGSVRLTYNEQMSGGPFGVSTDDKWVYGATLDEASEVVMAVALDTARQGVADASSALRELHRRFGLEREP